MKEHKIHVFYNSEDRESYSIIGSLLKRLRLSASNWNSRNSPDLPALAMDFHDNVDELFALTQEQAQEINSDKASVIMLVAPNLLLNMLTSEAGKLLHEDNAESLRLFVYCEKIAFKEVLETSRSNHVWITGSTGQHLSFDTTEFTVDDAACDANEEIQRCLKLWLTAKDATETYSNQNRGNTMTTPAENRLSAEIDFVKAKKHTEAVKLNIDSWNLIWALTYNFIFSAGIAFFVPTLSFYAGALALIIVVWAALIGSAIWQEHKAEKAYDRASAMETAYDLRTGLIGAD